MSSTLKRAVVIAMCTGALGAAGVGSAYAGEITGKGKSLKVVPETGDPYLHGMSECAYSGLNDEYYAPEPNDTSQARVQTPAVAPPGVPGMACNPSGARG